MTQLRRPFVCHLQGTEVLQLAAELESLGGGEVALARAQASLFVPQGIGQLTSTGLVLGQETYGNLAAYAEEQAGLVASRLSKELSSWLRKGLPVSCLLLQADRSFSVSGLISQVAVQALSGGAKLGLCWQQLGTAPSSASAGRAGRGLDAAPRRKSASEMVVSAASLQEMEFLLKLATQQAQQQQQQPHRQGSGGASSTAGWLFRLHVHWPARGGSLGVLNLVVVPEQEQDAVMRLLKEVAAVHKQQRAGEHPLVGSTLSAFSQALAPLVAGPQRLFVLAGALPKQQLEPLQQLAAILERISQIQVVCSRVTGIQPGDLSWVPFATFSKQHQLHEQQRQQEHAAALAATTAAAGPRRQAAPAQSGSSQGRTSSRATSRLGRLPLREAAEAPSGQQQEAEQDALQADEKQGGAEVASAGPGGGNVSSVLPPAGRARGVAADSQDASCSTAAVRQLVAGKAGRPEKPAWDGRDSPNTQAAESEEPGAASYAAQAQRKNGRSSWQKAGTPASNSPEQQVVSKGTSKPCSPSRGNESAASKAQSPQRTAAFQHQGNQSPQGADGVLRLLRDEFQQLYCQTIGPAGSGAASPSLGLHSVPSAQLSPSSSPALSHDLFSSLGGGSISCSPGGSLLGPTSRPISCASPSLLGPRRQARQPAGAANGQPPAGPSSGHAHFDSPGVNVLTATPGLRAPMYEGAAAGPAVPGMRSSTSAATQGPAIAFSQQGSPAKSSSSVRIDPDVSAHLAVQRLRCAMADQEQELQDSRQWAMLDPAQSPGRQEPPGPATAAGSVLWEAAAVGQGIPWQAEARFLQTQEAQEPGGAAGRTSGQQLQRGAGESHSAAQHGSPELELLQQHMLHQQERFAAEEQQWRLHQEQRAEQQRQQHPHDGFSGYSSPMPDAEAQQSSPLVQESPAFLGWDSPGTLADLARLDDATLSLGAMTRPASSFLPPPAARHVGLGAGQPHANAAKYGRSASAAASTRSTAGQQPREMESAPGAHDDPTMSGQPGRDSTLDDWLVSTAALIGDWETADSRVSSPAALSCHPKQPSEPSGGMQADCFGLPRHNVLALADAPQSSSPAVASASASPQHGYAASQRNTEGAPGIAATFTSPASKGAPARPAKPIPPSIASSSCPGWAGLYHAGEQDASLAPQGGWANMGGSYAALGAAQRAEQQPGVPHREPQAAPLTDPQDFNGLLAALQRERQVSASLQQDLQAAQRVSAERVLALEVRLATLEHQLAGSQTRCRAWEQGSPFAQLFQSYEAEVGRLSAEGNELREESRTLAGLLADSELSAFLGPAGSLAPDAAGVAREMHKRLNQAKSLARKFEGERDELLAQMQAMKKRDRVAELYKRQAEDLAKRSQDLQRQLDAKSQQLERQCLNAAESGARADTFEERLEQTEARANEAEVENADLRDTVESLRKQVALLRSTLSRDRVLQHLQAKAV